MNRNRFFTRLLIWGTLAFLVAANFGLALNLSQTQAAQEKPLVVQPDKIEIYGQPGQKIKKQFTLTNRGDLAVRMKVVVKDFRVDEKNGRLEFFIKESESLSQWLVPEFLEISLKSFQSKEVNFIATIPENAASGGYYGAILFEPASEKAAGPKSSFGVLVLLTVVGGESQASIGAKLVDFSAPALFNNFPAKLSLTLKNSGNTHLKTQGNIKIKDWRNREIAKFKTEDLLVYPGTTRTFGWRWNKTATIGFYRAEIEMTTPGKNPQRLASKTWFIVFPWKSVLYTLLVLVLLIIILAKYKEKLPYAKLWEWPKGKFFLLFGAIKKFLVKNNLFNHKTDLS